MASFDTDPPDDTAGVTVGGPATEDRVQCPNCCRLAPVTRRDMGLIFYRCALCFTTGAIPDDSGLPSADGR